MTDKVFLNGLANGKADILQKLLDILLKEEISYCVIGGLAVNAYVEPVVSLDLDIVVTASELDKLKRAVQNEFEIKDFPHSINLYSTDSDLRIQIQTDDRYQEFIVRSKQQEILGYKMNVALIEDVLKGKIWAYSDKQRRRSKRQKDLADIFRIVEAFPELETLLTDEIKQII